MRLWQAIVLGLVLVILIAGGVSLLVIRYMTPAALAPITVAVATAPAAAAPNVDCRNGTFAFSEEACERARQEGRETEEPAPPIDDPPPDPPRNEPTNTPVPLPTETPFPTEPPRLETVGAEGYASCEEMVQQLLGSIDAVSNGAPIVTVPTHEWGAYVFETAGDHTYTFPGWGHFDYWAGRERLGVTQDVTTSGPVSFACQDDHGIA